MFLSDLAPSFSLARPPSTSLPAHCIPAILALLFIYYFRLHHMPCRVLVPWPGIEPGLSVVRAWSPNH